MCSNQYFDSDLACHSTWWLLGFFTNPLILMWFLLTFAWKWNDFFLPLFRTDILNVCMQFHNFFICNNYFRMETLIDYVPFHKYCTWNKFCPKLQIFPIFQHLPSLISLAYYDQSRAPMAKNTSPHMHLHLVPQRSTFKVGVGQKMDSGPFWRLCFIL